MTTVPFVLYSDFNCPFCYVTAAALKRLALQLPISVEWKGYSLHPEVPASGTDLTRQMDETERKGLQVHLNHLGKPIGISFSEFSWMYPSATALEAACYARDHGCFDPFSMGVYRAAFTRNLNISSMQVLKRIAADCGLDPEGMAAAVQQGRYSRLVRQNREEARARNIVVLPTLICGESRLVGAKSLADTRDYLRKAIRRAGTAG